MFPFERLRRSQTRSLQRSASTNDTYSIVPHRAALGTRHHYIRNTPKYNARRPRPYFSISRRCPLPLPTKVLPFPHLSRIMAVLTHPFEWASLFLGIATIFGVIYYGIFKIHAPDRKGSSKKVGPLLLISTPESNAKTSKVPHKCCSLHWLLSGTPLCTAKATHLYAAGHNREKSILVHVPSGFSQALGKARVHIPSSQPQSPLMARVPSLRSPPPAAGLRQKRVPPVRPPRPARGLWSDESLPTTAPQHDRRSHSYLNRTPGTIISLTSSISTIDLASANEVLHESVDGTNVPDWNEDDTTLITNARWRVSVPPVSPFLPFPPDRHALATTTPTSSTLPSTDLPRTISPDPDPVSQPPSIAAGEQEVDYRERHYLKRLANAERSRAAANSFDIAPRPGAVVDYEVHNAAVNERTRQALMRLGPARDFRFPPLQAVVPPIRLVARVDAGVDGVRITDYPTAL